MLCAPLGAWCQVDASHHPDRDDLTVHQALLDVGSVQTCREVVLSAAAANGEPDMIRGDCECGVGPKDVGLGGGLRVCGETVR